MDIGNPTMNVWQCCFFSFHFIHMTQKLFYMLHLPHFFSCFHCCWCYNFRSVAFHSSIFTFDGYLSSHCLSWTKYFFWYSLLYIPFWYTLLIYPSVCTLLIYLTVFMRCFEEISKLIPIPEIFFTTLLILFYYSSCILESILQSQA